MTHQDLYEAVHRPDDVTRFTQDVTRLYALAYRLGVITRRGRRLKAPWAEQNILDAPGFLSHQWPGGGVERQTFRWQRNLPKAYRERVPA